jgi:putative ABC transport system permease protein
MREVDISILNLCFGISLIIIPIIIFRFYKVNLIKSSIIATIRMCLQLSFIAIYLGYIFELNSKLLNCAWVIAMLIISSFSVTKKTSVKRKFLILPLFLSSLLALGVIDVFFLGFIIKLDNIFDARYFIPISGMILGNSLIYNTVGLSNYFNSLKENENLYKFILINTNSKTKSLQPYIKASLNQALTPLITSMSVIGLISLPGMMTGQILGGSSPELAIKYQILIMIAIFVSCTLNLFLSIYISNFFILNKFNYIRKEIYR